MNNKEKGDLGEVIALKYLIKKWSGNIRAKL